MSYSKISTKGWRVTDSMRRLIYNLLRCPSGLWEALEICYSESKPEHAGPMSYCNVVAPNNFLVYIKDQI